MKLSQWNCYCNNTFKDRREDELPFIPGQAPAAEGGVAVNLKAPQTPSIKTVFTLTSEGVHKYDWLRPTLEEIVDTYTKLYGKES